MAAHLHRYGSELTLLSDIIQDVKRYNDEFHDELVRLGMRDKNALEDFMRGLDHASSQVSGISNFRDEMQQKIDNILALVTFNVLRVEEEIVAHSSPARRQ